MGLFSRPQRGNRVPPLTGKGEANMRNITDVLGKTCLVEFLKGFKLSGKIIAADSSGFTFVTQHKESYVYFEQISQIWLVPSLEVVEF